MNKVEIVSQNFCENYEKLLDSFDLEAVSRAIGTWVKTEGCALDYDLDDMRDMESVLERGFVTLLDRGIFDPITDLTSEGKSQLDKLFAIYRPIIRAETPLTAEEIAARKQQSDAADLEKQVIADFAGRIPTSLFKRNCMTNPAYLAAYESACAAGRI